MSSDDAFRHQVWSQLEPVLVASGTADDYLQGASDLVADMVGRPGSYSLSTVLYGEPVTIGSSDRQAWEADQIEFDSREGPCVTALATGVEVDPVDLTTETRWPAWTAMTCVLGFRSAAGIPADVAGGGRIALNLYSRELDAFDSEAMLRARLFTQEVARTIPAALKLYDSSGRVAQLEEALASRSTIDQALGVLMAQNRCTRDAAFAILRRASQNRNVKLRDVAALIIEKFTGHPAAPPPPFQAPRPRRDRSG